MTTAQRVSHQISRTLYWATVVCSALIGLVVVLPFYAYRIPVIGAGDLQAYDVKQYWPFGTQGPGAFMHDVGLALAFVAPLVVPGAIVWSVLLFLGSDRRRTTLLVPALVSVVIGLAYLIHWRAILSWHLD